jgi:hypothetical protein
MSIRSCLRTGLALAALAAPLAAHAAAPLRGTYEGTSSSQARMLRVIGPVSMKSKVRIGFFENAGALVMRSTQLDGKTGAPGVQQGSVGRILSDKMKDGHRILDVRFTGKGYTASAQRAVDAVSAKQGKASPMKLEAAHSDLRIVQAPDGTLAVLARSTLKRGKADLVRRVLLRKEMDSTNVTKLSPVK